MPPSSGRTSLAGFLAANLIKPFLHEFCISGYDRTIHLSEDELNRQREDDLKHIFAAVNKFCPR